MDQSTPITQINTSLSTVSDGWFTESSVLWPGQKFSLALDGKSQSSVVHQETSEYQDILVFRSAQYGLVLCLDGVIQITTRDEFAYSEMISHLPLHACDREAEKVLIVGGGDGCVLREVLKHQSVKEVVMVEIDPAIIKVAKKYFGHVLNSAFSDPRLTIVHSDAASYLINSPRTSEYDVIINDSSDPCGPSETLFSPAFFKAMYKSLKPGGVVASQSESMWMNIEFAADMMAANAAIYDGVEYGNIMIPSYPCGGLGMVVGTKAKVDGDVVDVRRMRGGRVGKEDKRGLLYYSGRTHKAAFEVPPFARRELSRAMGGRRGRGRSWEGSFDLYSSEEEEEGQTGQDDKGCVVT